MRFEWDIYKAIANLFKHGVSFEQAASVFEDDGSFIIEELDRSKDSEQRYRLLGMINPALKYGEECIVVIIFTIREGGERFRIISARPANREERDVYDHRRRLG